MRDEYRQARRIKKKFSYQQIEVLLDAYRAREKFQSFRGFLEYAGITLERVEQWRLSALGGNTNATHIIKILTWYKNHLEIKLEQWMIYQQKHTDLADVKQYDFSKLQWYLERSNRQLYGAEPKKPHTRSLSQKYTNNSKMRLINVKSTA